MNNMFKLDMKRSTVSAVAFFFFHALLIFAATTVIIMVMSYVLNQLGIDMKSEGIRMTFNVGVRVVVALYVLFIANGISKGFEKGQRLFALVFSVGAAVIISPFMGLMLPVLMSTMIEE